MRDPRNDPRNDVDQSYHKSAERVSVCVNHWDKIQHGLSQRWNKFSQL